MLLSTVEHRPGKGDRLATIQGLRLRERTIASYRVICVVRRADGHLRAVGYAERDNEVMYDDVWTIKQARQAIEDGHRLYTVSPSTGAEAELELTADGIRTKPGQGADHELDDLPPCG
jgi:hypothetical protein